MRIVKIVRMKINAKPAKMNPTTSKRRAKVALVGPGSWKTVP